jgi:hypothetical protein
MKPSRKHHDRPKVDTVDSPAIIRPDFAQTRHISAHAGSQKGWERLSVYEREYRRGHLMDKAKTGSTDGAREEGMRALERRDACYAFDEGWSICNASWPSGFDPGRIKVAGCPGSFVDHQRDVKGFWRRVELSMGTNDWMICRRVCGEGWAVAETIKMIAPPYRNVALVRFREALDSLITAMERSREPQRRRA